MIGNRFALTKIEIVFNRLFAVLLIISAPLLLFSIFTIPTVVIFFIFALFLLLAKKYHPIINLFFFLIALGIYFIPLPIGWGLFLSLREWRMGGFIFHPIIIFFYLAPLIFISLVTRNVLGNILSCFNPSARWRNLLFFISLITVVIAILAYPLSSSFKLRSRAMEDDASNSRLSYFLIKQELKIKPGQSGASSTALSRDYTARFDPTSNQYIYRLNLVDPLTESIAFTAVKIDGEKINFVDDQRVECPHCQIDKSNPYSLVFPAGQDIDFIVSSDQFVKTIEFTESESSVANFVFWK